MASFVLTILGILILFKINLLPQDSLLKIGLTVAPVIVLILFFAVFLLSIKIKFTKTKNEKKFYSKICSVTSSVSFFIAGISFITLGLLFFYSNPFAQNLGIFTASFFVVWGIFFVIYGVADTL